ncbi:MAG: hypothetical protein DRI48_08195 [Chloroflexi bacterium]|nr:MAG: hypothetical protein DRI48_08195 [Chloroflexota bacterium]
MCSKPSQADCRIVRLRRRDPELLASLDELHREFIHAPASSASSVRTATGSPPPPEQFLDFVTERLDDEAMLLIFALVGDTPVGYSLAFDVSQHPFMPEWKRAGYVTQMFVLPQHRRQGIGQRLFDFIVRWLRSREVTSLLLNVSVDNPDAERFWRKQGFVPHLVRMRREITAA